MRPTVEQQLRSRAVQEADLLVFLNRELLPWARQTRQATNSVYTTRTTLPTTGSGVFETIWTSSDIAVGKSWLITATIMGDAGAARTASVISGLFYNNGIVAQEGATVAGVTINAAAFSVQFLVVGNHVEAQVQDDGVFNVSWQCWIDLRETPQ